MTTSALPNRFDVHPLVVFQLGETLISDDITAITELVKNSYDADANWVRVEIDTNIETDDNSFFPGCKGQIIIEDDGTGMDASDISRGWLTVSNSIKRETKTRGEVTPRKGRTPLGDKGLGRLGVQRLGDIVELDTAKTYISKRINEETGELEIIEKRGEINYYVGLDWREFSKFDRLEQVPVKVISQPTINPRLGTKLTISGLHDADIASPEKINILQRKLSQFLFPIEKVRPFRVYVTVNGQTLDLVEIASRLRNAATSRFTFSYKDGKLTVKGKYKLFALRPSKPKDQAVFDVIVRKDRAQRFFKALTEDVTVMARTGAAYLSKDPWIIATKATRQLDRLGGCIFLTEKQVGVSETQKQPDLGLGVKDVSIPEVLKPADPGPFDGEIDTFELVRDTIEGIHDVVFDDFKDTIKRQSGIRVFRDGFAIRPYGMTDLEGNDWLRLGTSQTVGASFYGLRPNNVIGYVAISASKNKQLEEKTDREGFTDTPFSRNFFLLMQEVVAIINDMNTTLRRKYNKYRDAHDRETIGVGQFDIPEVIYGRIRETSRGVAKLEKSVSRIQKTLEKSENLSSEISKTPGLAHDLHVKKIRETLDGLVKETHGFISELTKHMSKVIDLSKNADILERDLLQTREQISQFSELAALGLTAEAISHELHTVAGNLAMQTKETLSYLKRKKLIDSNLITYTEYVRSAISALRKQLNHLAPALRYLREQKDVIDVGKFLNDLREFHKDGFARNNIQIVIDQPFHDFTIRINRGKLTQVLDNLLLNSKYWLKHDLAGGYLQAGYAHIASSGTSLLVWDNGRGVAPDIEELIFEPFVTRKPKGEGRGLGLFIVKQLLASSGCAIHLLPERNQFGSRYIFQVDLVGALDETT